MSLASAMPNDDSGNIGQTTSVSLKTEDPGHRSLYPASCLTSSIRGARTGRTRTRVSTANDESVKYTVALLQSKGSSPQVGIAAYNLDSGHVTITQLADTNTFARTMAHLMAYPPLGLLIHPTSWPSMWNAESAMRADGLGAGSLVAKLESSFEIEPDVVPTEHWSAEAGLDNIRDYSIGGYSKTSTIMAVSQQHYALCATGALFYWLKGISGQSLNRESLQIRYMASEGTMFIDVDTASNLELVKNNLTHRSSNTLFDVVNACHTPMGERLLRSNILQPSNDLNVIENRLDAVQELLSTSDTLNRIRSILSSMEKHDLDGLFNQLRGHTKLANEIKQIEGAMIQLLMLKSLLEKVSTIGPALEKCQSRCLLETIKKLSDKRLGDLLELLSERFVASSEIAVGSAKTPSAGFARLFALRSGINPMLDVARQAYREDIQEVCELEASMQTSFPECKLEQASERYRFFVTGDGLTIQIPSEAVHVERLKNKVRFTTEELLKREFKLQRARDEVLLLSASIGSLYALAEAIATLDVVASFAWISSNRKCIRPEFNGTLAIRDGRHPILDQRLGPGTCVPNDLFAVDGSSNLLLVQGANMAGKSTYIRQAGLLTVQAMIGCFVPAEYASFKLHDSLMSRLSNDDAMQKNLSTFALEMATSAMILGLATCSSLVLIDELGRGTAPLEGLGLSQAIAEALLQRKAFTLFATHFHELARTLGSRPAVKLCHMQSLINSPQDNNLEFSTTFDYKVIEGPIRTTHYGLELAKLASFPAHLLDRATAIATRLATMEEEGARKSVSKVVIARRRTLFELRNKLKQIAFAPVAETSLSAKGLRSHQTEVFELFAKTQSTD